MDNPNLLCMFHAIVGHPAWAWPAAQVGGGHGERAGLASRSDTGPLQQDDEKEHTGWYAAEMDTWMQELGNRVRQRLVSCYSIFQEGALPVLRCST